MGNVQMFFLCVGGVIVFFSVLLWLFSILLKGDIVEKPFSSTPEVFCLDLIKGFKKKASFNKNESMIMFCITMAGSLLAPIFVSLGGEGFIFSKVIPSALSVVVAFGTAWLQLRKPQHLWALYRGCQRKLEDNFAKYKFKFDEYNIPENDAGKILAQRCAEIAMEAHNEWLPIMPKGENISSGSSEKS